MNPGKTRVFQCKKLPKRQLNEFRFTYNPPQIVLRSPFLWRALFCHCQKSLFLSLSKKKFWNQNKFFLSSSKKFCFGHCQKNWFFSIVKKCFYVVVKIFCCQKNFCHCQKIFLVIFKKNFCHCQQFFFLCQNFFVIVKNFFLSLSKNFFLLSSKKSFWFLPRKFFLSLSKK